MAQYNPSPQELEAMRIISSEIEHWWRGDVWITDKVNFQMREIVEKSRKNYLQIYESPSDPVTGRRKMFVPFTEYTVETVVKNIDIDTKDIEVKSKNMSGYKMAFVLGKVLRYYLEKLQFGKKVNEMLRNVSIDGTAFFKIWKDDDKVMISNVDRLNMIYDPTVQTLDESSGIIERNILTKEQFDTYEEWDNKQFVEGDTNMSKIGIWDLINKQRTEIPYVQVYERYGLVPKFVLTGSEKDRKEYVYALIVASGDGKNARVVHKIKEVDGHPYQDFKFKHVNNRMDGRGIAEMTFSIQAYINEVVNTRLNVSRISQQKLWKVKGNITPQQMKRLWSFNAIKLDANDDVEMIDTGTVDNSTYTDEANANTWGQRVTQTQFEDVVQDDRPATNALIQERGSNKSYNLVMEGISLALEKMLKEKLIPLIKKTITPGELIRITGDPVELAKLHEDLVKHVVYKEIAKVKKQKGYYGIPEYEITEEGEMKKDDKGNLIQRKDENKEPVVRPITTQEDLQAEVQATIDRMKEQGKESWIGVSKEMFDTDFDVQVSIGDEQINKGLIAQNLVRVMQMMAQNGLPIKNELREFFDVLGMDGERMTASLPDQLPQPQEGGGIPMQGQTQGEPIPETEGQALT